MKAPKHFNNITELNCTPKVRQKTFGVQFIYEKDI